MNGWMGKILEVDLTKRGFHIVEPDTNIYHSMIGGKGLCGHYLRDHITREYDDPQMPLLLFTGPLVGTSAPTSGRMTVMTRSPLTGTIGDASVGGRLGTEIKHAGFDGIIIRGHSESPVGIEIENENVSFVEASELLGLPVSQAMARLKNKGSVALTGAAAENDVRFASIMVDRHFAIGRGGLGLSFAKKNLKYLTVKGGQKVSVHDPESLKLAREDIFRLIAASPVLLGEHGIRNLGTPALFDLMHARRMMPTSNFQGTFYDEAPGLNANALRTRFTPKRTGCRGCHIMCKKVTSDNDHLPEFETLSHFTALCNNNDLEAAVDASRLCNEYGMDTISTAATIACYLELSNTKLNKGQLVELVDQIGAGRGLGKQLKEGSARYAKSQGKPELSMSVKGQELPAYDPRGAYGMALAYATSTRGGCHLRAYPVSHEILRKPVVTDRFSFEGKARIIKIAEDHNAIIDSLTACKFVFFAASLEEYAKAYQAVTGLSTTANDLSNAGERIYYSERIMNAQNGFGAKSDDLPMRFFKESGTAGPGFEVPAIDRADFLDTRAKYYRIRGLDKEGKPTRETAARLGIQWKA
jgi:aldehyde:ferredoxin oxidoreductase